MPKPQRLWPSTIQFKFPKLSIKEKATKHPPRLPQVCPAPENSGKDKMNDMISVLSKRSFTGSL
jgi:hypothetical protein